MSRTLRALLIAVSLVACAPTEVREVGPPPSEALEQEPVTEPPFCDASTRRGIEQTVDGQLTAFALRDFEAALEFSIPAFREGGVASFRALIEESFPELLDTTGHRVGMCTAGPTQAFATVEVTTAAGPTAAFQYLLERGSDGRWRVGAILPQADSPSEDISIT